MKIIAFFKLKCIVLYGIIKKKGGYYVYAKRFIAYVRSFGAHA